MRSFTLIQVIYLFFSLQQNKLISCTFSIHNFNTMLVGRDVITILMLYKARFPRILQCPTAETPEDSLIPRICPLEAAVPAHL